MNAAMKMIVVGQRVLTPFGPGAVTAVHPIMRLVNVTLDYHQIARDWAFPLSEVTFETKENNE